MGSEPNDKLLRFSRATSILFPALKVFFLNPFLIVLLCSHLVTHFFLDWILTESRKNGFNFCFSSIMLSAFSIAMRIGESVSHRGSSSAGLSKEKCFYLE